MGQVTAKRDKTRCPVTAEDLLALLDALPASVALWDNEVRLRYGNRRALRRFGRPRETLLGARLSDVVQSHAVELSAQYIDGALAGRPQQVERAMVDANGQRYNAHQVTHIPNIVDDAVQGYCALAVDITASIEGYEQARALREQDALLAERERIAGHIDDQRVVDELSAVLQRLDAAVHRASDALPSLTTAADAIDRAIDELRATVPTRMLGKREVDVPPVAFPGTSVPIEPGCAPPGGVPWPPDITGRGWSAEQVCALLDLLPAAIVVWDASLHTVFANCAAVRWFGRADRDDVVGEHARDLLGPRLFEANATYAQAALRGEPQLFDRTVAHPSGRRHLQASYRPRVRNGRVDGVYAFVVDVTSRVEAELALQDARAQLARDRERERIADDLHNLVIQRLFAAGLAATRPASSVVDAQLGSVQGSIAAALVDLESAMTALHEKARPPDLLPDLARRVHTAVPAGPRDMTVAIENVGSVDYIPPAVAAELLAVAEAALSNVVAHSGAGNLVVTIAADAAEAWLRVVDDGCGLGDAPQGRGMAEMAARAARLGGTCTWRANRPCGTVVDCRIPIGS